jgi:hypothetical protein
LDPRVYKDLLESIGFEGVTAKRFELPLHPWPKDEPYKHAGFITFAILPGMLEGLCMRLFTKIHGWTVDRVKEFCREVVDEVRTGRRQYQPYFELLVPQFYISNSFILIFG